MNDQELIRQLKGFKNIHPSKEWVNFTRAQFASKNHNKNKIFNIFKVFELALPRPASVAILASVVVLLGGVHVYRVGLVESEVGSSPALTASLRHVSRETAQEVAEIQELARSEISANGGKKNTRMGKIDEGDYLSTQGREIVEGNYPDSHTVVFNKDAEERENFQTLLEDRIKTKIAFFKDLFAQLDDGERVREITLNPRRFEENFKGVVGERGEQVLELLNEVDQALEEGDLIIALDLVNAIEKSIKD